VRRSDGIPGFPGAAQHEAKRSGALQTRDRYKLRIWEGPGSAVHHSADAPQCTASGTSCIGRRDFITLLGGAAATWPLAAGAQQPALPKLGFLSSRTAKQAEHLVVAFLEGLKQAGFVDGQNVTIEYRYAGAQYDQLRALAEGLVSLPVAVIVAGGTSNPAMTATKTIPIVFTSGIDPVLAGLVSSLNHPDGNVTGATFYSGALGAKQMGFLRELAPRTTTFGLLVSSNTPSAAPQIRDAQSAARTIGCDLQVLNVVTEGEIDAAFAALAKLPNAALLVAVDPYFDSRPDQIIGLASQHALPTAYYLREFVQSGGLLSYGASITDVYRQAGVYAGRILKGEKPSDLPVQLPTRFELVINLKTAKTLGLTVPLALQAAADEVIE
jgi:putative tryptophan/tyrosine transport system substrate-binding protein